MKYILLIRNNADFLESLTAQERDGIMADVDRIVAELTETGEFLGGQALGHPSNTRTVRVRDGLPVTIDGPFAEAKEQLGGFWVIEAPDLDVALKLAAQGSKHCNRKVEVRPFLVV